MTDELYQSPEDEIAAFKAKAEAARQRMLVREEEQFWRNTVLASPVGRRIVWKMLDELDAFRTAFRVAPAGVPDEAATWYYHGRSTWGFEVYQRLSVISRDGIAAMHDELDPRFMPEAADAPSE